ncbi:hypothetical protein Tco_0032207 [Tanacetum coccineum]
MEVWIKKLQENANINTRNQNASLKNLETQIEQLTEELRSKKEKYEQAKAVFVEHEGPSSPKKLKNLHGISFLSDSQEENTNDQLPMKESNPGHFTLPCTIDQTPNSTVILGRPFLATVHSQISVFEKEISVGIGDERSERYSEWCNKNSHDEKPRPRDYTFKEWVKLKNGHLNISRSVRKDLCRLWVIDQFTEALDPDKDHLERCLDEYNWVFHKEIEQLTDEYEIKFGEKGQVLEEIWTKCKRTRCKNKDWWKENGSRFRKMIMEEMEEVLGNDREDSNKIWDNEDVHDLGSVETNFPAIVFNDTLTSEATLSCEPTVSSFNNNKIDFRISFDESGDEDYTVIYDKNSFSYKIISVNDLKTDLENDNDKVNMPSFSSPEPTDSCIDDLDFFKDFENEFPAIVYNDALTSKLDFLTEPAVSPQHIDEFNLKDETSLSECDEEEQNVLNFNDLFPFNVNYPNDSKSDKDNDDDKVDIEHSLGNLFVKPLPDVINTDVGAYAHRSNELLETRPWKQRNIDEYWWRIYKFGDLEVLES